MAPVQRGTTTGTLEDAVTDAVRALGGLAPGEVLTHFDLVAETRMVDEQGKEHVSRHHWSPVGSNPHLSFGLLAAQSGALMRQINSGS